MAPLCRPPSEKTLSHSLLLVSAGVVSFSLWSPVPVQFLSRTPIILQFADFSHPWSYLLASPHRSSEILEMPCRADPVPARNFR